MAQPSFRRYNPSRRALTFDLPKSVTNRVKQGPLETPRPDLAKNVAPRSLRPTGQVVGHTFQSRFPPLSAHHRPLKHGHNPQRGRQPRQPRHRKRRRHPRRRRPRGRDSRPGPGPTPYQRRPIRTHALPAIGTRINAEKRRANRWPETELCAPPGELIHHMSAPFPPPKNTLRWRHSHSSSPFAPPCPPTGTRPS